MMPSASDMASKKYLLVCSLEDERYFPRTYIFCMYLPEIGIVIPFESTLRPARGWRGPAVEARRVVLLLLLQRTATRGGVPVVRVENALLLMLQVPLRGRSVRVLPLPVRVVLRRRFVVIIVSVGIQPVVRVTGRVPVSRVYQVHHRVYRRRQRPRVR